MTGLTQYRSFILAGGVLVILVTLARLDVAGAAEDAPPYVIVGAEKEIFATPEAADLAVQARAHDPLYCPREQRDRDQAARLYERAIAAQPGARINARLADRIAQMYAFYEDKEKGVVPDRNKAHDWWRRCLELTGSHQLVWAQAQMGLASVAVIGRNAQAALAAYNRILEIDVNQVVLPDWRAWPEDNSESSQALLERERAQVRESLAGLQGRAVEKLFYVLSQASRIGALGVLENLAARRRGTPVGDRAAALIAKIHQEAGVPALDLLETTSAPATEPVRSMTLPSPAQGPEGRASPRPAPAEASGGGCRGWCLALSLAGVAALTGAGIARYRQSKRTSFLKGD
jgi:tetratricopeptide (TPR) repeat protein